MDACESNPIRTATRPSGVTRWPQGGVRTGAC